MRDWPIGGPRVWFLAEFLVVLHFESLHGELGLPHTMVATEFKEGEF